MNDDNQIQFGAQNSRIRRSFANQGLPFANGIAIEEVTT